VAAPAAEDDFSGAELPVLVKVEVDDELIMEEDDNNDGDEDEEKEEEDDDVPAIAGGGIMKDDNVRSVVDVPDMVAADAAPVPSWRMKHLEDMKRSKLIIFDGLLMVHSSSPH
jgi:hypothetical protein